MPINPLVPDAHYSERQDKPFSSQIRSRFKEKLRIFIFYTLGTNGLTWNQQSELLNKTDLYEAGTTSKVAGVSWSFAHIWCANNFFN